jgi:hypothetical protein
MDNAGNCDTTAVELNLILPSFGGAAARLRCLLHILNLIAKVGRLSFVLVRILPSLQAFIQFFFKPLKRKKAVKVAKGTKRKRTVQAPPVIEEEEDEAVLDEGDFLSTAEEEIAQVLDTPDPSEPQTEDAQEIHDTHIARSIRDKAIAYMRLKGVIIGEQENRTALGIFPKVRVIYLTI